MTVSSDTARADYTGNGVTKLFTVPFRFLENTHLRVIRTVIATGVETVLTLDSTGANGFTATGAGQPSGGSITVVTAPANTTEKLSILSDVPITQLTDYIANDPFAAESHERALDKLTMIARALKEKNTRALSLTESVTGVNTTIPAPVASRALVWNSGANGLINGELVDPALRTDMSSNAAGKGGELVGYRDPQAPPYLQTVSDILNGLPVSLHRFIPKAQHAAIRGRTSTYDATADINSAFASDARVLLIPRGLHNYAGNLNRTSFGLALRGESHAHSILRAIGAGGIVFNGGSLNNIQHNAPKLDLSNLRIEAAVVNAGTAVSMSYTGGSGTPSLGPVWSDVVIVPSTEVIGPGGPGFTRGVYGFNLRDVHFNRVVVAGNSTTAPHPITPSMTEGMFFDGNADAIELWLSEVYAYYLQTGIKVRNHEGVYIDRFTSLAVWHGIDVSASQPQPTVHLTNSYIGSERTGAIIDMISYFDVAGNTFNPTAPVPNANYIGLVLNRSDAVSNNQTNFGRVTGNKFIGVGYSTSTAFTETAVHVISANTTAITDNDVYDMNVGVRVDNNALNTALEIRNRNRLVDTPEIVPRATRKAIGGDVRMRATIGGTVIVPVNIWTKLTYGTELEDKGDNYYDAAGGAFRPPAGPYKSASQVRFSNVVAGDYCLVALYRNGVEYRVFGITAVNTNAVVVALDTVVVAGSADTFEVYVNVLGTSGTRDILGVPAQTFWDMYAISD